MVAAPRTRARAPVRREKEEDVDDAEIDAMLNAM